MICPICKRHRFRVIKVETISHTIVRHRACKCGNKQKTTEDVGPESIYGPRPIARNLIAPV